MDCGHHRPSSTLTAVRTLSQKRERGFTLIEILLVIAILSILLGFVMIKLRPLQHRREAHDIQRKADIRSLQHSVTQYAIDKMALPPGMPVGPASSAKWVCQQAITGAACTGSPVNGIDLSSLVPTYLVSIPVDPTMTGSVITGYKLYSDGEDFYPIAPYLSANPTTAGPPSSAPQNPMIAQWKLDDASGTSAADSSGNDRTGTLLNGPTWTTGILTGGLQFDGTNDTVTVPHSVAFDGLTSLSLSTWIMPYTWRNAQIAGISDMYSISLRTDGRLQFTISPFESVVSLSTAPNNQWTHVALVFNGSTVSLYVNGIFDTSYLTTRTIGTSTTAFTIGGGTSAGYYHGKIDDVQWTKAVLPASGIAAIVAAAAPFSTSQVGYWKFDNGAGTSATDSSGNGFTASLINGPTWVTSTAPTNFSNSHSLKFDGTDDYARVPYNSTLDFRNATSFSVTVWAYLTTAMPGASLANMMTSYERGWLMYTFGDFIRMYVTSASVSAVVPATVPSAGWHHVAAVWDGERLKLYMDGVLANMQALASAPGNSTSSAVLIGGYYGNGTDTGGRPDYLFNEKIDELRILNRPLSAAEVKSLASGNSLPY